MEAVGVRVLAVAAAALFGVLFVGALARGFVERC